jgi:hypothetical protein
MTCLGFIIQDKSLAQIPDPVNGVHNFIEPTAPAACMHFTSYSCLSFRMARHYSTLYKELEASYAGLCEKHRQVNNVDYLVDRSLKRWRDMQQHLASFVLSSQCTWFGGHRENYTSFVI